LPSGAPDVANLLAGAECFIDIDPVTDGVGCLHTRNLTNHATGLANRTDAQIKAMFMDGLRPNSEALIPVMPYWSFHNMTDDDADAIVAYLRTVPGVDHAVPANETPWAAPPAPATAIDPITIPSPVASNPNFDSAMRGRYLSSMAGVCLECHTPEFDPQTNPARPIDMTQPFAGGRVFPGLPMPPFTAAASTSANLTSHATGLAGWDALDIIKVLEMGVDPDDDAICPPMPAGPMAAYGGLTSADATDIANYILTLPGIDNQIDAACSVAP
jgi:mono/diheme cytochrome c family protein